MTLAQQRPGPPPGPYPPMPGAAGIAAAVTAVMPRPRQAQCRSGLIEARMTDLSGAPLYRGWIPAGARVVVRGSRVFMHWQGDEWRQIPVVTLGEDGRPL